MKVLIVIAVIDAETLAGRSKTEILIFISKK